MTERGRVDIELELDELLLRRMIDGLDASEADRLSVLLAQIPESDADRYERLAALVMLASVETFEPVPEGLRRRIMASSPRGGA